MTTLLFYKNIVTLDTEAHKSYKIAPADNLNFTADITAIPVVIGEFVELARQNPIAFLRTQDGSLVPVALLGLPGGKNLYLDDQGKWNAPYIPAFIRRYPFVFAETGPDQLTLCVDADYEGFNQTTGTPLFDEQGQASQLIQEALRLLTEFQRNHTLTQNFVKRLDESGILVEGNASASLSDGRNFTLQGMLLVDEAKFRALPEATLKEWFASGELGLVYAHLISLGNLLELLRRQPAPAV